MKKLFATFLAVLYISVSSGATLHFQYCMGQFVKVTILPDNKKKCEACGMAKLKKSHNNCCKAKHQHLQIEKDQKHSRYTAPAWSLLVCKLAGAQHYIPDFLAYVTTKFSMGQAPPIARNTAVFIRNCNFRI